MYDRKCDPRPFLCAGILLGILASRILTPARSPQSLPQINNISVPSQQENPAEQPASAGGAVQLGAPLFRYSGAFKSDINGQVFASWYPSPGAKSYQIQVFDQSSQEVKKFVVRRGLASIQGLKVNPRDKFTPYTMIVTPLGENGETGTPSEPKAIEMLPLRNLAPPSIKSITTEQ